MESLKFTEALFRQPAEATQKDVHVDQWIAAERARLQSLRDQVALAAQQEDLEVAEE